LSSSKTTKSVRETTAELLREAGHSVIEVADGVEGLVRLNERPVDVIVLDLRMPRLDGIGFLERCTSPPPVVVVSAFDIPPVATSGHGSEQRSLPSYASPCHPSGCWRW
jgi:two-component system, NtrC family, nitrogen regulation response regulator NtrX